jgi:hypothetical protein
MVSIYAIPQPDAGSVASPEPKPLIQIKLPGLPRLAIINRRVT